MADDAAGSCLSDLSDDLLRHILFFAPAKEGAATALLSRRWRWLWRTSGAVNLDSRSFKPRRSSHAPSAINRKRKRNHSRSCSSSSDSDNSGDGSNGKGFPRSAEKALAAANIPIRRLTFFISKDTNVDLTRRRHRKDGSWSAHNQMEALICNPAARRVEELRIEVEDGASNTACRLSFGSLPSGALRVLYIRRSTLTAAPPAGAAFPRLAHLHLQGCSVVLEDLLSTIAAAPQLTTLQLQSSYVYLEPMITYPQVARRYRFVCGAVTALVIADCTFGQRWDKFSVELDVPRLQYFRYEGSLQFAASRLRRLKPQAATSNMILHQVDLHLSSDRHYQADDLGPISKLFWEFVQDFSTAKQLKLKLDLFIDKIVLKDDEGRDELLGSFSFCRLEQLELEAKYNPRHRTSTLLLADLLHCCPTVRDLRLKFIKDEEPLLSIATWSSVGKEAGVDYDKSVNGFRNRRRRSSMASFGGENGGNYQPYGIIPGLTRDRAFSCLQSHLERVSLHFCMDEPNCLGVQLAKFFAENAMVLQEMYIDDGGQEMLEHVNFSLRTWIETLQH